MSEKRNEINKPAKMPRKGFGVLWFSPKFSSSSSSFYLPSPVRSTFSESMMDRTLEMAEPLIMKWNPDTATVARVTSLFYDNRREATDFIKTVNNLQKAMHFVVEENSATDKLSRCQNLMQIAMKRLQKEFYQILSMNRAHLDPESVSARSSRTSTGSSTSDFEDEDDEIVPADKFISEVEDASTLAMADLRSIAECMISAGYTKECVNIYTIIRKSIVDEGIYKLGVEKIASSRIRKMDWEALDSRIVTWLKAVRTAVRTLFCGERIICDHVFASSDFIRETCFTEITKEGAAILFGFPELVAKDGKNSPEKVFRVLDMYTGISNNWPEIQSIFSFDSTTNTKSEALASLEKLGEFVRFALDDFESKILKDSSKTRVAGAGIHPLTIETMDYLTILSDHSKILSDILADSPAAATKKKILPESYFGFSDTDEATAPAISMKIAWLILVLLCKLDTKAKYYRDVSLAYLFLANNLQYVVVSVQTSNLKYLLGQEWVEKKEEKIKMFISHYERLGWGHVIDSVPSDLTAIETPEKVHEIFKKFNSSFDQAYKKQGLCVVPNTKLRAHMKVSIAEKITQLYRNFYRVHRRSMESQKNSTAVIRYAPEDVRRRLSDLFFGHTDSGGSSLLD